MQLTINGETRQVGDQVTVEQLLQELAVDTRQVAVECNRQIVPKSQYGQTQLTSGDAIEIVEFIGGG